MNWPEGSPAGHVFIVSNIAVDRGCGSLTSEGSAAIGLAFTMATTSAISVTSNLCVSWLWPNSVNMASNTRWIVLICLSHTPPKCDAWGGLNSYLQPHSVMNFSTFFSSNSDAAASSSVLAPMKFVPRSHLRSLAWPPNAKSLLNAQIKALESIASKTSMWMALLLWHVNTRPQRLAFTPPPLVLRVCTAQGPKTSNPTLVKGGQTSVLCDGRSAIRCSRCGPLSYLLT